MAKEILMKNPQTGIIKKGFYGFSWTTFFFSGIPALMRGDTKYGILMILFFWVPLVALIMAFIYNKNYTLRLVEAGYRFAGSETENEMAKAALGISGKIQ